MLLSELIKLPQCTLKLCVFGIISLFIRQASQHHARYSHLDCGKLYSHLDAVGSLLANCAPDSHLPVEVT